MTCEVDIHLNVTVSSDSSVSITPKIHYKNSTKSSTENSTPKKPEKKKRTMSDPGPTRPSFSVKNESNA